MTSVSYQCFTFYLYTKKPACIHFYIHNQLCYYCALCVRVYICSSYTHICEYLNVATLYILLFLFAKIVTVYFYTWTVECKKIASFLPLEIVLLIFKIYFIG